MGNPENKIERKLCEGVRHLGGRAYKLTSPGYAGLPDRLICLPFGRVVFVELKSPKGRLSKLQIHRIGELEKLKQDVWVLSNPEQVEAFLQEMRGEIYGDI